MYFRARPLSTDEPDRREPTRRAFDRLIDSARVETSAGAGVGRARAHHHGQTGHGGRRETIRARERLAVRIRRATRNARVAAARALDAGVGLAQRVAAGRAEPHAIGRERAGFGAPETGARQSGVARGSCDVARITDAQLTAHLALGRLARLQRLEGDGAIRKGLLAAGGARRARASPLAVDQILALRGRSARVERRTAIGAETLKTKRVCRLDGTCPRPRFARLGCRNPDALARQGAVGVAVSDKRQIGLGRGTARSPRHRHRGNGRTQGSQTQRQSGFHVFSLDPCCPQRTFKGQRDRAGSPYYRRRARSGGRAAAGPPWLPSNGAPSSAASQPASSSVPTAVRADWRSTPSRSAQR